MRMSGMQTFIKQSKISDDISNFCTFLIELIFKKFKLQKINQLIVQIFQSIKIKNQKINHYKKIRQKLVKFV